MSEVKDKSFMLTIRNRDRLELDGVINVEGFGEEYLILSTALGELTVEGSDLKIESLTKENGEILIIGKINGLFYKEDRSEHGFFKKLFR